LDGGKVQLRAEQLYHRKKTKKTERGEDRDGTIAVLLVLYLTSTTGSSKWSLSSTYSVKRGTTAQLKERIAEGEENRASD